MLGIHPQPSGLLLLYVATFFSIASAVEYFALFFREVRATGA